MIGDALKVVADMIGASEKMILLSLMVAGVLVLFGVGYWLRDWVGRRRFERTNEYGVQGFEGYDGMKRDRRIDGCAYSLGYLAYVFALTLAFFSCCLGVIYPGGKADSTAAEQTQGDASDKAQEDAAKE